MNRRSVPLLRASLSGVVLLLFLLSLRAEPAPESASVAPAGTAAEIFDAETKFRSQVEERTRTLGPEHPDTLKSRLNLTYFLRDLGRREEAVRKIEPASAAMLKLPGDGHPDVAKAKALVEELKADAEGE